MILQRIKWNRDNINILPCQSYVLFSNPSKLLNTIDNDLEFLITFKISLNNNSYNYSPFNGTISVEFNADASNSYLALDLLPDLIISCNLFEL